MKMADKSELTMLQEFVDAVPNTQTGALVQWAVNRIAELEAKLDYWKSVVETGRSSNGITELMRKNAELKAENKKLKYNNTRYKKLLKARLLERNQHSSRAN
jgi:hypothetical protein